MPTRAGPPDAPATAPWGRRLDGTSGDAAELGGKGAALDRLVAWGLPVPSSGAVTSSTYRLLAADPAVAALVAAVDAGAAVAPETVDAAFLAAPWPAEVDAAVLATVAAVADGGRVAVRSSATVEDLEASSFAGQYRSLLDVDASDADAVRRAVRLVFASLWHPAPCAYRRAFGIAAGEASMAAVVMRMVPARRAGVVFTVDPSSGGERARVEQVAGLGDALVSGRETPEAATIARGADPSELGPVSGRALALALDVERRAGCPQDVEWAWDGATVWLVQARPVTAHGDAVDEFDDPVAELADLDLTTAAIGEMLPGVLPPLVWGVDRHLVEEAFRRLLDGLGVLPGDLVDGRGLVRRVRGRAAIDFSRLRAMSSALPGAAGDELEAQYFGSRRADRPTAAADRAVGRVRSAAHDARVLSLRGRAVFDAELTAAAAELLAGASDGLHGLGDRALLARHTGLVDLAVRATAAELAVAADAAALHRRLELVLTRHLGPERAGRLAAELTSAAGLAATTTAGSSAAVVAGPTWDELGRTPPVPPPRVPPAEHAAAVVATTTASLELARGWTPDHWRLRLAVRVVRRLTTEAVEQLRRRERTKAALLAVGGELRRTQRALGGRLAARGLLASPDEVELLAPIELRRAVERGVVPPPDVRRRRRRAAQRTAQDGPLPYRFRGLPPRRPVAVPTADRVEGWAASAGRFVGAAVVVREPTDPFPDDGVLVAPATDPSWSPLFVRAGAIVLERGGPLSHAAILARELGVPAVLNVPGACQRFGGRRVLVDGDAGVVAVVSPEPAHDRTPVDASTTDGDVTP